MLGHILILQHITLSFCEQFSICASFEKNHYYLSDVYLERLQYVCMYVCMYVCIYVCICCKGTYMYVVSKQLTCTAFGSISNTEF